MSPDDKEIAENIAFRAANTVGDRMVAQIKSETKLLADAVRQAALSEIDKTRMQIEASKLERHAEIEHHATTCPVKAQSDDTKAKIEAVMNRGYGAYKVLACVAGLVGALVAFFGSIIFKNWLCK